MILFNIFIKPTPSEPEVEDWVNRSNKNCFSIFSLSLVFSIEKESSSIIIFIFPPSSKLYFMALIKRLLNRIFDKIGFKFLVTFLLGIRYDVIFFPLTFGDITSYTGT